ncbi:MAG: queuine tRNA-ribosyltransferase [archaeon GW2011_AR17]|nr:MAG: queuine tRNA-ribosyltransferase [archaeon GW2011_AR17]MBS3153802.1 tRNA guanosine(34) transglycosylase Tgt [Candidatus Woesearchaeota archaeon]HIH15172.1 tRNA guanosine(34) transglycosylase Tgt [Nanoarchaeota archaeon]HIH59438.1 tRNA guanosine(34) transglycosylase Tgt [Nanoarchaeota archaeon]HII13836.1 tRNA guanosine(34) transglycosylase Tgt [Nanoarchaeota archaeon]
MFTLLKEDGQARTGILQTKSGEAETPFFMPVATKAVGRFVSAEDYIAVHAKAIIANAFFLSINPCVETFEKMGGIHKFMQYPNIIFTDCGGFQMLRENLLLETTNNGILLKNPSGKDVFMRPEKLLDISKKIDSDVIMALDCVLPYGRSKEEYREAVQKSHQWTKKCKDLHTGRQLLFGITQGGTFEDLRETSAKAINAMDFDGHAIGGVGIGEPTELLYKMVEVSIPHLDKNKPRYVMGLGKPEQIIGCVERGIDIFDSIYPQKNARHGMLFTFSGIMDLGQSKYKFDKKPIEESCLCFSCKTFSRAYLRYLFKKDDAVGKRYLTIHNLYFMQEFMKKIRENIHQGTFQEFKEEFLKAHKKI